MRALIDRADPDQTRQFQAEFGVGARGSDPGVSGSFRKAVSLAD
jgi:hypothetical protein